MVEPGNLAVVLAFHQDRANRLLEQTQRRVYGGAARAQRHGGIVKIFHWEGEPQGKLDTAITSLRTLQLIIRITASTSDAPPSSRTAYDYTIRHLYTARQPNKPYTPQEVCDEPLIPHPTRTAWTYRAVFCLSLYLNPPSYILVLLAV